MRRIPAILALVAALVVAMSFGSGVLAQEEPAAGHPVLGSWVALATPATAEDTPELISFHAEGSVRSAGPDGTSVGSWEPTGERSADVTFVVVVIDPTTGTFVGLGRIRGSLEVSEDGQSFTGSYTFEPPAALAGAMGLPVGEFGPGEVTAERITVEAMGEPVGPIPEFPPEPGAPEGSPMAPGASPIAPEGSPIAPEASPMVPEGSPRAPEASPTG